MTGGVAQTKTKGRDHQIPGRKFMLETLRSTSGQLRGAEIPWSNKDEQGQTHLKGYFFPAPQAPSHPHARSRGLLIPCRDAGWCVALDSSRLALHQIPQDMEFSPAPILHLCPDPALPYSHGKTEGLVWAALRLGGFCFGWWFFSSETLMDEMMSRDTGGRGGGNTSD